MAECRLRRRTIGANDEVSDNSTALNPQCWTNTFGELRFEIYGDWSAG